MARIFSSAAARRMAGLSAVALMIAIGVLSLLPVADLPPVEGSDKLKHFIAYAALGAAMTVWAGPGRALRAFLITVGYGALIEIAQALAPTGREFSLLDEGANTLGAGLATLLALLVRR